MTHEPILLPDPPVATCADYLAQGGGEALRRARQLGPDQTIQEILLSGLRGRGGAGFPTGRKWLTVRGEGPDDGSGDRYVVCNAAEGEPGTFKDRAILRANPYQVVEGVAVAAATMGAREAYIGMKASFTPEVERVQTAVADMADAGIIGDIPISLVTGPEEYLFGEETGLLQVIEGDAPLPRLFPPYLHGLFTVTPNEGWSSRPGPAHADGPPTRFDASNPTLVNNVETLAMVTHILTRGADWHRRLGTKGSAGVAVCTVVGDVRHAGVGEVELGTSLGHVIDTIGGGVTQGRAIKAVLSGVSNAIITADNLDVPITYEHMQAIGTGLGSCGFIVYDDTTSAVELASVVARFLYVESCGQCPACKLGTEAISTQLDELATASAEPDAIEVIGARLRSVTDGNRCYLPVEAQQLIASLLRAFPEEFADAEDGHPVAIRGLEIPKLVDVRDGQAIIDAKQTRKRPDWTYA